MLKRLLLLTLFTLAGLAAFSQTDPPPPSPTAKPVTSYQQALSGDTSSWGYQNGKWYEYVNRAWAKNHFILNQDAVEQSASGWISGNFKIDFQQNDVALGVSNLVGTAISAYGYSYFGGPSNLDIEKNVLIRNSYVLSAQNITVSAAPVNATDVVNLSFFNSHTSTGVYKQLIPTSVKTTAYTASAQDLVYTNTTSGNVPITLPNAPVNGTLILVKMITLGSGYVTPITTSGSDVFNKTGGSTSITLSYVNQGVGIQYNSGIWTVLWDDLPVGAVTSIASSYAPQNYYYIATGSEGTGITVSGIVNMVVASVNRQGNEFQQITSGSPNGNQVLVNTSTGALTFANSLNANDAIHVTYASATSATPTAPVGLQILYAANYATASTYFTGSNTLLVVVKNDEVNGGTNPDGSYATTIYTYSYNNSTGSKLFFVRTAAQ